ncbi:MAG: 16S rRNA processing protein RimM [Spirochaetales bacterium]|jgi:16S rRNA processing protein RimM|nr:16S rRNA processing protein RimM [Spirochaetales bacterium]
MDDPLIWTATIRRPFGVHGAVKVHTHNAEFRHLAKIKVATLRAEDGSIKELPVKEFQVVGGEPVLIFEGYESPEQARTLNGMHLLVKRSEASPLKKGEYYTADLIGCDLVNEGIVLGNVVSTVDGAQALLLEVALTDDSLHLVPFLDQYIGAIDIEAKTIELLTPWILA